MDYVLLYKNIMYINGVTRVESEQYNGDNITSHNEPCFYTLFL